MASSNFALAALCADLERATEHAKRAKMDAHFVAECDHLLATARFNLAAIGLDETIVRKNENENDNDNESERENDK